MMMMIHRQQHPTVEVPSWDPPYDDPIVNTFSPQTIDYFAALQRYLPANEFDSEDNDSSDLPFDSFSCDNFRMYEFKVRRCARGRSHDWTECPYAHPGEKARRRDPRKYHYSGVACPEFRRGSCRRGDSCEFAHGVFECWLHPARYRTQPCKDGSHCQRRVCFFAHSTDQLRVVESPPSRLGADSIPGSACGSSPTSILVSPESLPESPPLSPSCDSVSEVVGLMRGLQIGKVWGSPDQLRVIVSPPSRICSHSFTGSGFGSPRSPTGYVGGFCGSLPSTPTPRTPTRSGLGRFDPWDMTIEEELPMERVESGKDIRAKIYAKLSKENSLEADRVEPASPGPDFGWVSELVK